MKALGISIYPAQGSLEENLEYISTAAGLGFTRIFTCLLSVKGNKDVILKEFAQLTAHAQDLGMRVIADVSPDVFKDLNIDYKDLSFFADMKLWGIRLDLGFSGIEESIMTYNPYNIKIEINMSNGTKYLDNIMTYKPNIENLIGCHNFYPHRYTGLSRQHFLNCTNQFKSFGVKTAAFISSRTATFGPWPVNEGLCTLEEHRNLSAEVQAKDLFHTDLVDDVIIANAFASKEELLALSSMDKNLLMLKVEPYSGITELEKKIVEKELHFNRGDVSEYMIRSTQSRVKYSGQSFPLHNPKPIKRGDILIESSFYERYAGELQIALKDMDNSGKTNVVGKVALEEVFLIDHITPWQKFRFSIEK